MEVFSAGSALTAAQESELNALVNSTNFAARTFDPSSAVGAGASTVGTADYASLLAARGWTVVGNDAALILPSSGAQPMLTVGAQCTGTSGYTGFFGAFWQWALNSCDTATLIAAVAAGGGSTAGIGGLLAALGVVPAGGITAAVGGLIAAGAGVLTVCQTASYGMHAIYLNAYVIGGVGCWGQ